MPNSCIKAENKCTSYVLILLRVGGVYKFFDFFDAQYIFC